MKDVVIEFRVKLRLSDTDNPSDTGESIRDYLYDNLTTGDLDSDSAAAHIILVTYEVLNDH